MLRLSCLAQAGAGWFHIQTASSQSTRCCSLVITDMLGCCTCTALNSPGCQSVCPTLYSVLDDADPQLRATHAVAGWRQPTNRRRVLVINSSHCRLLAAHPAGAGIPGSGRRCQRSQAAGQRGGAVPAGALGGAACRHPAGGARVRISPRPCAGASTSPHFVPCHVPCRV